MSKEQFIRNLIDQTNAIQFESHMPGKQGSWLFWPKAKDVTVTENGFIVAGEGPQLHYEFSDAG